MATQVRLACRYYIKNTINPRICGKKSPEENTFVEQGVCGLHLCNQHFNVIQRQIVNTIGDEYQILGSDFNFNQIVGQWNEYQAVQMNSLLQHRKSEFFRVSGMDYQERDPAGLRCGGTICGDSAIEDCAGILEEGEWQNILVAFQIIEDDTRDEKESKSVNFASKVDIIPVISGHQKECPICFEQFSTKNMTFLECAHALCNGCLSELQNRNIAQCPICRHDM